MQTHLRAQHLDKIYFLRILELENISPNLLWGRLGNQEKSFYGQISACSTHNEFLRVLININSSFNSLFRFSETLWLSGVSKPSISRGIFCSQRCSGSEAYTLAQKLGNEKFQSILESIHCQLFISSTRGAWNWGEKEVSSPYFQCIRHLFFILRCLFIKSCDSQAKKTITKKRLITDQPAIWNHLA